MCVCVCVVCVCGHVHISSRIVIITHTHVHIHTCTHTYTHTYTHVRIHTHTHTHMYAYIHTHSHTHSHTVPDNFHETLGMLTQKGLRVIAVGHRTMQLSWHKSERIERWDPYPCMVVKRVGCLCVGGGGVVVRVACYKLLAHGRISSARLSRLGTQFELQVL